MSLGNRLRKQRENNGWSQIYVAERIGITNSVLSNYERDYRDPDTETLTKLADLFDVDTDYLLGRTDKPRSSVEVDSGRAYRDGGKGWTDDEIQAADEFIEMLRRRDAGKQKGK